MLCTSYSAFFVEFVYISVFFNFHKSKYFAIYYKIVNAILLKVRCLNVTIQQWSKKFLRILCLFCVCTQNNWRALIAATFICTNGYNATFTIQYSLNKIKLPDYCIGQFGDFFITYFITCNFKLFILA